MKSWSLARKVLCALTILIGAFGVYPVSYLICPDWSVTVVDRSGAPLSGMTVRRSCNDYSAGPTGIEDNAITDERGRVSFAAREIRSPIFFRWTGRVVNVITQGFHAGFGRHSYVFAFGRGLEGSPIANGEVEAWRGRPAHMESRIVATPVKPFSTQRPAEQ